MSYDLILANDLIENPSARCAVTLVLDTSASMSGSPIQQLNEGFQLFLNTLSKDEVAAYSVDVSVITAGGQVQQRLPFTSLSSIEHCEQFSASGMTPLGGAVDLALSQLEARKQQYKANGVAYYQPWLVIISDGEPNDNWQQAAAKARHLSADKKLVSLVIGVAGANMQVLGEFSNRPAIALQGVKFKEFFTWLSASMSRVSASSSTSAGVDLPPMDSWASI